MLRALTHKLAQFKSDRRGVTALEYGMIAALISVIIVGAVTNIGKDVQTLFNDISTAMGKAQTGAGKTTQ